MMIHRIACSIEMDGLVVDSQRRPLICGAYAQRLFPVVVDHRGPAILEIMTDVSEDEGDIHADWGLPFELVYATEVAWVENGHRIYAQIYDYLRFALRYAGVFLPWGKPSEPVHFRARLVVEDEG